MDRFLNILWLIAIILPASSPFRLERQVEIPVETKCRGGFDVYFVLDTSGSITETHFQEQTVNFVEELYSRFTSTKLRVSFITFQNFARTVLPLTDNSDDIDEGIKLLREIKPRGGTKLSTGLGHALQQIELEGTETASVVIALTDGLIGDDKTAAELQADKTRSFGGTVLAVRVGEFQIDDLLGVANVPPETHIFRGDTFDDLESIIAKIIDTSCVEVLSVTPDEVCANETLNVTITGNGFDKTINTELVHCNFKLNDTDHRVKPYNVTSTKLVCESPPIPNGQLVEVQVSVNNISFISSNVTVLAIDCTVPPPPPPPNVLPVILGLFGGLLFLGLFLLWWFWNLLCCSVVLKDEPKAPAPRPLPPTPTPPPPPPPEQPRMVPGPKKVKSWPKVDVSLIGGVGAGGIRPVQVRWGSTGNTEAAIHLERGKQASVVGEIAVETAGEMVPERPPAPSLATIEEEPQAVPSSDKKGCCSWLPELLSKIFAPIRSFYDRLSVMRPQPGEGGRCCNFRREK